MRVKTNPAANLCHVGTPMIAVAAEATPRRSTRAPHARVPTLTSTADASARRPYGLARGDDHQPPAVEAQRLAILAGDLDHAEAGVMQPLA